MRRKQIVIRAVLASVAMAVIGIGFNAFQFTANAPREGVAMAIEPNIVEVDPRLRSRVEHGEDAASAMDVPPPDYELERIQGELDQRELELQLLEGMEPQTADESRRLSERKRVIREDINELRMQQTIILQGLYPTAAGSEPPAGDPPPEFGAPKGGPEDFVDDSDELPFGLDANNIFNKVWGLLQALVVAWATLKFQQRKKQVVLTDSTIDRIDEKLLERHRKKMK